MKKISIFIVIIFFFVACKKDQIKHIFYLDWPVDSKTSYIILEPGECINPVYGNHFLNSGILIGGKEGQPVYSPIDCTVKYVMDVVIKFPDGEHSISWKDIKQFLDDDSKPNYSFISLENTCSVIGFNTKDGRSLWISGLNDYNLRPGDQILKGQKIGNMGFVKTISHNPSIYIQSGVKTDSIIFADYPEKLYKMNIKNEEYNPKKKLTQIELFEDIDLFFKYVYEDHPALINPKIRNDFYEIYKKTKSNMKDKEISAELKKELLKCLAVLNCSHTRLIDFNEEKKETFFPLLLKYSDGKCIVISDYRKNKNLKGCQVLTINGKDVSTLYNEMIACLGFDSINQNVKDELNMYILSDFYSFYGVPIITRIMYLDLDGKKKNGLIRPILRKNISSISLEDNYKNFPRYNDLFTVLSNNNACITLQRIDQLSNKEKVKDIFRCIRDLNITSLTIDLRDNPGGEIDNAAFFFSFFTNKPYKMYLYKEIRHFGSYISINDSLNLFQDDKDLIYNNFLVYQNLMPYSLCLINDEEYEPAIDFGYHGRIIVLINAGTSSIAVRLAELLQEIGAEIQGSETSGGAYFTNGFTFTQLLLPNSNIILDMPLYRVVFKEGILKNEGLYP